MKYRSIGGVSREVDTFKIRDKVWVHLHVERVSRERRLRFSKMKRVKDLKES